MNTVKAHFSNFFHIFDNVIEMFSGSYSNDNNEIEKELEKMKVEFKDGKIPGIKSDRENLKSDRAKVSKDYNKAVEEKKRELSLHG